MLDINALVKGVDDGAARSDLFEPDAIRVRAIAFQHYRVAGEVKSFIHLRAQILSGRSDEQKQHLSRCLFDSLELFTASVASVSVDIVDMERGCYIKRLP